MQSEINIAAIIDVHVSNDRATGIAKVGRPNQLAVGTRELENKTILLAVGGVLVIISVKVWLNNATEAVTRGGVLVGQIVPDCG